MTTSLRAATSAQEAPFAAPLATSWLARTYWVNVTKSLIQLAEQNESKVKLVRYEELVANPIVVTQSLYEFIGSSKSEGTKTYSPPSTYAWRWGSDDGSSNIKSLEVQPPRKKKRNEKRLLDLMKNCEQIKALREQLGYE